MLTTIDTKILEAHYKMQSNLYLIERYNFSNLSLFSGIVDEPEWNHAVFHSFSSKRWEEDLEKIDYYFQSRGKETTIAISSLVQNEAVVKYLLKKKWKPNFCHSTLLFQQKKPSPIPLLPGIELRRVQYRKDMQEFIQIFCSVFLKDSALDMEIDRKKYTEALWNSFDKMQEKPDKVFHYLAMFQEKPAGIGTALHAADICGLCNLAVLPEYRRLRLGEAITKQRIADAMDEGASLVFLQTEREVVRRWQCQNGFKFQFEVTGYSLPRKY